MWLMGSLSETEIALTCRSVVGRSQSAEKFRRSPAPVERLTHSGANSVPREIVSPAGSEFPRKRANVAGKIETQEQSRHSLLMTEWGAPNATKDLT